VVQTIYNLKSGIYYLTEAPEATVSLAKFEEARIYAAYSAAFTSDTGFHLPYGRSTDWLNMET